MHYCALVWLPELTDDVHKQVKDILEPFQWFNEGGFWDFQWFIGGRWAREDTQYQSQEEQYQGYILPVSEVRDDTVCFTLIVEGNVFHKEVWIGEERQEAHFSGYVFEKLKEMGIEEGFLVTVDYHGRRHESDAKVQT